jgi:hypothetical protein
MKYALISQRQMIEIESAFETKRLFATVKDIEVIDKALKILHLLKFSDAVGIIGAELAKPEQAKYSDIVSDGGVDPRNKFDAQHVPQVCCGDYEKCCKACTPRGRWLANQQMNRLEQEKGQFVGGVPSVSQEREWAGLTDAELMKEFGYTDELLRNTAYRVDQLLEWKNT